MKVVYSPNKISITFEQHSTYYYIQTVVERNELNKIGRKNKIIIFPCQEQDIQRKYLLKLIAKIYKKQNPNVSDEELVKLKKSYNSTIKLTLELKNQILPDLKIHVDLSDEQAIVFNLENNNRLFVSYMKNYFKDHLLQYRARSYTLTIFPNSDTSIHKLQKLFFQREHMAWYITFDYNLSDYNAFATYWFNKYRRKKRFKALNGIMEEYFQMLGCKSDDSYQKVRQRYLQLAKMYHPDRHTHKKDTSLIVVYREKFEKIQTAYDILKAYFQNEKNAQIENVSSA